MTFLLAILGGIVGAALGFALGAGLAAVVAPLLGITGFEGEAGYFTVFVGGPLGALAGLVLGAVLVLRRRGRHRASALFGRVVLVAVAIVALGGVALGVLWMARPLVNPDGPAPQLVFEIRLPASAVSGGGRAAAVELQTSRNRMPGSLEAPRLMNGHAIVAGSVEIYFRTVQRTLVLTLPDKTDLLFELRLGLTPAHNATFGEWQRANFVAEPGKPEARRATASDGYDIRYRVVWAGEE